MAFPESGPVLTAAQRAALDPRVDAERLERLLARLSVDARRFAVNACLREPTEAHSLVGFTDPALHAAWLAVWRSP